VPVQELLEEVTSELGVEARAEGLDAAMLANLEAEYTAEPTTARRKLLAHALVWHGLHDEARQVLAPHWGSDLDDDEVLLLLWLDQRTGEADRMRAMAQQLGLEMGLEVSDYDWRGVLTILAMNAGQNNGTQTMMKVDASRQHISRGGQWGLFLGKQQARMFYGIGDIKNGDMLLTSDGRVMRIGARGTLRGVGMAYHGKMPTTTSQ